MKRIAQTSLSLALAIGLLAPAGLAQVSSRKTLNLEGSQKVIAAAEAEARRSGGTGVIAVVDAGGNLMALQRLDGTFDGGANISIGKARRPIQQAHQIFRGHYQQRPHCHGHRGFHAAAGRNPDYL